MSRIKRIYLSFYDVSDECYENALKACHEVWVNNECNMTCSSCQLQEIKSLYAEIHNCCRKGLTE